MACEAPEAPHPLGANQQAMQIFFTTPPTRAGRRAVACLVALLWGWAPSAGAFPMDPAGWEALRLSRLDNKSPAPPSVASELAVVAKGGGEVLDGAMMRLIDAGPAVLPEVHAALLDEDFPDERKPMLLLVIGRIGDASSAEALLAFGGARPETHEKLVACLRMLQGAVPTADAFVLDRVADTGADPWVRHWAMLYLADHGLPEAATWADTFRTDASPDFQATALYADAIA